jgi:hypothetical protein
MKKADLAEKAFSKAYNNFEFPKVKAAMEYFDWKWAIGSNEYRVPTEEELRQMVLRIWSNMGNKEYLKPGRLCGTGGFTIMILDSDTPDTLGVQISFNWAQSTEFFSLSNLENGK